jgi:hypothetical protein
MRIKFKYLFFLFFVFISCSRHFYNSSPSPFSKYSFIFNGKDEVLLTIHSDSSSIRVDGFSSPGIKIVSFHSFPDSLALDYIYDDSYRSFFNQYFKSPFASKLLFSLFSGLYSGFVYDSSTFSIFDSSVSYNYCQFICYSLSFNKYKILDNRYLLDSGQLQFLNFTVQITRL